MISEVPQRHLYTQKWSIFSSWCSARGVDPLSFEVAYILSFLQELLDGGCTLSTLKVYIAAIAEYHTSIAGLDVPALQALIFIVCLVAPYSLRSFLMSSCLIGSGSGSEPILSEVPIFLVAYHGAPGIKHPPGYELAGQPSILR